MTESSPTLRGRGRPSSPLLSRERIAEAAIELVNITDYRGLTMSSLAKELGVSTSALYNHVSSKHDVLMLIQDRLNGQIKCSAFKSEPWDQALRSWAHSYRASYIPHTALIPVMAVLPVADAPATLHMYEEVTLGLQAGGITGAEAVNIIVGIEALVFGAAYDASAPADIFDLGVRSDLAPTFASYAAERPHESRSAADQAFDLALSALIDGLRMRKASISKRAAPPASRGEV